jgi:hypothetical protein
MRPACSEPGRNVRVAIGGVPSGTGRYRDPMRQKKRWSDLSRTQQMAIVGGALVELVTTTSAVRDLLRRPNALVRGPKVLWALSFVVQPFGPLAYKWFGRRRVA